MSEFKFHKYNDECKDHHDCENCEHNLKNYREEPCKKMFGKL